MDNVKQKKQSLITQLWRRANEQPKRLLYWYVLGSKSTPPPDLFKQILVRKVGKKFGLHAFVETGTYHGDMTAAARKYFDKVYSVEIHKPFYDNAVKRFESDENVKIVLGDSATALKQLLQEISEPALFWLDAHGGKSATHNGVEESAPVRPEMEAIFAHKLADKHVIMVDDIHTFIKGSKWGVGVWKEVEALEKQWQAAHPEWVWKVKDNVLYVYNRNTYSHVN